MFLSDAPVSSFWIHLEKKNNTSRLSNSIHTNKGNIEKSVLVDKTFLANITRLFKMHFFIQFQELKNSFIKDSVKFSVRKS